MTYLGVEERQQEERQSLMELVDVGIGFVGQRGRFGMMGLGLGLVEGLVEGQVERRRRQKHQRHHRLRAHRRQS